MIALTGGMIYGIVLLVNKFTLRKSYV